MRRALRVAFLMLPETGHHVPTFRLARELQRRGHHVHYLGPHDLGALVRAQGFGFKAIDRRGMPPGWVEAHNEQLLAAMIGMRRRVDRGAEIRILHAVKVGEARRWLERPRPDVLLVDSLLWSVAFCSIAAGIPTLLVTTDQSSPADDVAPPVRTALPPARSAAARAAVRAAWAAVVEPAQRAAARPGGWWRLLEQRHGMPGGDVSWTEWGARPALPEICLGPRALDLPRARPVARRVYAGAGVDRRRVERGPMPRLARGRPLVYAAVGSNSHVIAPTAGRLLHTLVEALRRRPRITGVIQLGPWLDPEILGAIPDNVRPVAWVPQTRLIRRAAVVVTHGGFGTVKECAAAGVPMIVFPITIDTPGNAARVVHHRLGEAVAPAAVTPEGLGEAIDRALDDRALREGVATFAGRLRDDDGLTEARRLVEARALDPRGTT